MHKWSEFQQTQVASITDGSQLGMCSVAAPVNTPATPDPLHLFACNLEAWRHLQRNKRRCSEARGPRLP